MSCMSIRKRAISQNSSFSSGTRTDFVRVAHLMGAEMEKRLEALCGEIAKELGSCEREMVRGRAHVEIVRYAREKNIDLIVMSSHGLSGLEDVLFGSTAERVLRASPCHVFIVKAFPAQKK